MKIIRVKESSKEILQTINKLLPQLSPSSNQLSERELSKILKAESNQILLATHNGEICGMLTLVICHLTSGNKAVIEDVAVDEAFRGRGIGKMLMEEAIAIAKDLGLKHINLTSNRARLAANALYRRIGFKKRDTNVYRLALQEEQMS